MGQASKAELDQLQVANEQRMASREELLQPRVRDEVVFIPSLDASIKIRSFTLAVRREVQKAAGQGAPNFDPEELNVYAILYGVIEPKLEKEDIEALRNQDAAIIDEIVAALSMHNSFGAIRELKKGLEEIANSDSPLSSQNGSD